MNARFEEFKTNVELYRRGLFDSISWRDYDTNELFKFHPKQLEAIELLNDNATSFIGFGGAARGGKSALICADALLFIYAYPKSRVLIGRKKLKNLFETTWVTMRATYKSFGITEGVDCTRASVLSTSLHFPYCGSEIILKNCTYEPSDPEMADFGSLEIVRAYLDQTEQIDSKVVAKVQERIGSHKATSYHGLIGKQLDVFNPSKNHVHTKYWIPYRNNNESDTRKLVRSLPTDNPSESAKLWVEEKKKAYCNGDMSETDYQKQVLGNFDYDDDPNSLCSFDAIEAIFTNDHVQGGTKYITADIARLGSDKAVVKVWSGWKVIDYKVYELSLTTEIQEAINAFRVKYQIPRRHAIADQDGLGAGVVDNCGIVGFVNNARPFPEETGENYEKPEYKNLKSQCAYYLAKKINDSQLYIECEVENSVKEAITQELGQLKSYNTDKDGKVQILPKEKVKDNIGRSPDFMDTLLMRSYFDVAGSTELEVEIYV